MHIEGNILEVKNRILHACERSGRSPEEVTLVAITKTVEPSMIRAAFQAGIRHFGENRVQEAESKLADLQEIRTQSTWHMVGHLQTNKAKTAAELFDIIQSVDSLKLAEFLSRHAQAAIPILLEINAVGEAAKSGFSHSAISGALRQIEKMPNLKVEGLMTVAPLASDSEEVRPVFHRLRELRDSLGLKQLSMGMTDDFEVAIEEGATLVRIGRAIFGERRLKQ
ncbi:MAG: YggS family pyridoxal phosphate-dependent enzyme [Dehalococcoidia bacterium]